MSGMVTGLWLLYQWLNGSQPTDPITDSQKLDTDHHIDAPLVKLSPSLDKDDTDPITGLTNQHKKVIKDSWSKMSSDLKAIGVEIFIELFQAHPCLQAHFTVFKNIKIDELRVSKRMAAHGSTFMHGVAAVIDNLDDAQCAVEMLKTTGRNHQRRNIPREDFDLLLIPFLKVIKRRSGESWSPATEEAWTMAIILIKSVIQSSYSDTCDQ